MNMKSALITIIITAIAIATASGIAAGVSRPTNEWVIFYDGGRTKTVIASDVDTALRVFRDQYKHERIYSASQRSYVLSEWIWIK